MLRRSLIASGGGLCMDALQGLPEQMAGNRTAPARLSAVPLQRRSSAIVLWSGASRLSSHITSTLRWP